MENEEEEERRGEERRRQNNETNMGRMVSETLGPNT